MNFEEVIICPTNCTLQGITIGLLEVIKKG